MTPLAKIVTAPESIPVSLQTVKDFLRVDGSDEDAQIESLIKAATKRLEDYTELKFVTQTWDIYFDHFPTHMRKDMWWDGSRDIAITELVDRKGGEIVFPFGPVQSVSSVIYFLDDDTQQTFASSNYVVDSVGYRGRIALKTSAIWPTDVLRTINAVKIQAVLGFGLGVDPDYVGAGSGTATSQVPKDIQDAIKNFVAILYEHRGDELPEMPPSVLMMMQEYVRYKV